MPYLGRYLTTACYVCTHRGNLEIDCVQNFDDWRFDGLFFGVCEMGIQLSSRLHLSNSLREPRVLLKSSNCYLVARDLTCSSKPFDQKLFGRLDLIYFWECLAVPALNV